MEDLRKNPNYTEPTMNTIVGKSTNVYTNHLPKNKLPFKIKRILIAFLICLIISGFIIFPYEIGDGIGYWLHSFWTGLTHRFI